jgi:hypothetical protein
MAMIEERDVTQAEMDKFDDLVNDIVQILGEGNTEIHLAMSVLSYLLVNTALTQAGIEKEDLLEAFTKTVDTYYDDEEGGATQWLN